MFWKSKTVQEVEENEFVFLPNIGIFINVTATDCTSDMTVRNNSRKSDINNGDIIKSIEYLKKKNRMS